MSDDAGKKSQLEKFRELARELECDEDEGRFSERLKRIAKYRPTAK